MKKTFEEWHHRAILMLDVAKEILGEPDKILNDYVVYEIPNKYPFVQDEQLFIYSSGFLKISKKCFVASALNKYASTGIEQTIVSSVRSDDADPICKIFKKIKEKNG